MALYIMVLLLTCLIAASLVLHYGFAAIDLLPEAGTGGAITERAMFDLDYGFILNIIFIAISGCLVWLWRRGASGESHDHDHGGDGASMTDRALTIVAVLAFLWLSGGILTSIFL